jgi:cytochrome c biogenesis protein CcdA
MLLFFAFLPAAAIAQPGPSGPKISLESVLETDAVHAGTTVRAAVIVTLGDGWHVNAHQPRDEYLIPTTLAVNPIEGVAVRAMVYPEAASLTLPGGSEALLVYSERFVVGVEMTLAESLQPGPYTLEGTLRYQACDSRQCYPPKSMPVRIPFTVAPRHQALTPHHQAIFAGIRFGAAATPVPILQGPAPAAPARQEDDWRKLAEEFTVTGAAAGYLKTPDFLAFLDSVESGRVPPTKDPFTGKSVWFILLFAVGGGLLLNLTPCVLPLIPINLGIIGAGAKAGSRSRGFLLGGAYGAAIALTYGVLGLVVILGVSGTFGAINATPWFNGVVAVIFVLLSLAMFDVFLIDFTRFQTRIGIKRKGNGSFLTAFAMGAISALLAGACVAPVIISTIVYAQDQYAQGAGPALALPFLVGVGMGLPWPFAGAGLSFLPKPGRWMERIKYAFGVLILLFAVYYGHLAYTLFRDRYLVDTEAVRAAAQQMDQEGWRSSLAQGLDQAQQEGKPVLVDFWATWCKNCLTMNQTTFKNSTVISRLGQYVKIKFQAEDPADPATKAVLDHFGIVGLPTYIVLAPKAKP